MITFLFQSQKSSKANWESGTLGSGTHPYDGRYFIKGYGDFTATYIMGFPSSVHKYLGNNSLVLLVTSVHNYFPNWSVYRYTGLFCRQLYVFIMLIISASI